MVPLKLTPSYPQFNDGLRRAKSPVPLGCAYENLITLLGTATPPRIISSAHYDTVDFLMMLEECFGHALR